MTEGVLMNRRSMILGAASVAFSSSLRAEQRIIPSPFGPLSQAYVKTPNRIVQECPSWCWAASAAMIFAMNGHPISQQTIINAVLKGISCQTAMPSMITELLSRKWIDQNGVEFQSSVSASYDFYDGIINIDNNFLIQELENDRPLLYCNRHHAMALVSIDYFRTPTGPQPVGVGVLDPWPLNPAFHKLEQKEMLAGHRGGDYTYLAAVKIG